MTPNPSQVRELIERLREKGAVGLDLSPGDWDCREAASALSSLLSEREAMELNARRYRLAKKHGWPTYSEPYKTPYGDGDGFWFIEVGDTLYRSETINGAIDAALAAEKEQP